MQNRKGFTLIELLIVVVIIGILAAIAIPKFANTKEKAYLASMKSDLKNLATAQEGYFADNTAYKAGTAVNAGGTLTPDADLGGYTPSAGVTITYALSGEGWNAETSHSGTDKTCDIFMGSGATTAGVATVEGEPKCTN